MPPGTLGNVQRFLAITTWGVVTGMQCVEARDVAQRPTVPRPVPTTENDLAQMSTVPRLSHPQLNLETHLLEMNTTGKE